MSVRVVAGLPTVVLVGVALLLGGCALLAMRAPPPDEPPPYTLRAAVEPARAALERGWPHTTPVHFRFLEARCAVGAAAVLVFEQAVPGEPRSRAIALTNDVAAGIYANAWWERYDVTDPDAQPDLVALLDGREIACS